MPHVQTPAPLARDDARQQAARELAKPQYHVNQQLSGGGQTFAPAPSTRAPQPPPTPPTQSTAGLSTILVVILAIVIIGGALILVLRRIGRPRTDAATKTTKKKDRPAEAEDPMLVGAALHRRTAERAAAAGRWQEAIRERFRAVIATLDERGLLPDRMDRTADEAARDAAVVLPDHLDALAAAARAFDDVEYGDYVGTPHGYSIITTVDEQVMAAEASAGVGR
jgi:hypothetical protein